MRHLSIRRMRSLAIVVFVILICIFTFMAIANKNSVNNREGANIADSLGDFKEMKDNDLELDVPDDSFTKEMNKDVENDDIDNNNSLDDNLNDLDNDDNNGDDDNLNYKDDSANNKGDKGINIEDIDNDNNLDATDDNTIDNDNNLDAPDDNAVDNDNNLDAPDDNNDDNSNSNDNDNNLDATDDNTIDNDNNLDAKDDDANVIDNDNNLDAPDDNNDDNNNGNDNDNNDDNGDDNNDGNGDDNNDDNGDDNNDGNGDDNNDGNDDDNNDGNDDDNNANDANVIDNDNNLDAPDDNDDNNNGNDNDNNDDNGDDNNDGNGDDNNDGNGDDNNDGNDDDNNDGNDDDNNDGNDDDNNDGNDDTNDDNKGKSNNDQKNNEDIDDKTMIDIEKAKEDGEKENVIDFKSKESFKLYHRGSNYRDGDDPKGKNCPIPWKWTDDKEGSDIIALNVLDNLSEINNIDQYSYDKNRQKLLLMSMESTSNYDVMITKKKYFDYAIDYRLDSDVPIPYTYDFFNFSKPALPLNEKGKGGRGIAAVFISNCNARNRRLEFLNELMKHAKIDSYGTCLKNKNIYPEDDDDSSWSAKMNTIRKYKFTLAFENSDDRDYVTEKFFQPLEAGSVPIFYGTSNIADFAPEHSYIDAKDFKDAKALADYLNLLDKDDKEYEKYLEWKTKNDLGDNLKHLIEIRKLNSICQLLQSIKGLWKNPYLKEWDRKDVSPEERACILC